MSIWRHLDRLPLGPHGGGIIIAVLGLVLIVVLVAVLWLM